MHAALLKFAEFGSSAYRAPGEIIVVNIDAAKIGRWGEEISCAFLRLKGLSIIARNYRAGRLELDIVASDKGELVFVEVKVRSRMDRGGPFEAVGAKKQSDLTRAAAVYLARTGADVPSCRFDVIGIAIDKGGNIMTLRHIERAFESGGVWGVFS